MTKDEKMDVRETVAWIAKDLSTKNDRAEDLIAKAKVIEAYILGK